MTLSASQQALCAALLAYHQGDQATALALTEQAAAADPAALLPAYARRFLATGDPTRPVYEVADGFQAFIRGGGNLALYAATSAALQTASAEFAAPRLLDVGAGDGMALLPALTSSVAHVTVVEPAAGMLATLTAALEQRQVPFTALNLTAQELIEQSDAHWELAQATFSLQSIPQAERPSVLRWLRDHADRLVIVEFDTPRLGGPASPERAAYMVERYEQGLAEYVAERDLVGLGFLMPMFFGAFDPAARPNDEQPAADWAADLAAAGWDAVEVRALCSYWWSDAVVVTGRAMT